MSRLLWALLLLVASGLNTIANAAVIDSGRSVASFTIHPRLPIPSQGRFESLNGALAALPNQQWKVEVQVDAGKLSFKGPQWLARMARSEAFLDAEKHPNIQFVSMPFHKDLLGKGGELRGQLFLRGQQQAVSFHIEKSACKRPGYDCDLVVNGSVMRRKFGMQDYRFSIKDNVDFEFRIRLLADPAP
jgi:polyisoprenoid-binding protein YceI